VGLDTSLLLVAALDISNGQTKQTKDAIRVASQSSLMTAISEDNNFTPTFGLFDAIAPYPRLTRMRMVNYKIHKYP
jgi:hypothetical protein